MFYEKRTVIVLIDSNWSIFACTHISVLSSRRPYSHLCGIQCRGGEIVVVRLFTLLFIFYLHSITQYKLNKLTYTTLFTIILFRECASLMIIKKILISNNVSTTVYTITMNSNPAILTGLRIGNLA